MIYRTISSALWAREVSALAGQAMSFVARPRRLTDEKNQRDDTNNNKRQPIQIHFYTRC
jgi:hypothetical protein